MICPECYYEKWDGLAPHLYGGRESAGMTCYGPKRRNVYAPPTIVNRPIPPTRPAVDTRDPTLDRKVLVEIPDKPLRKPGEPKLTKAQKAMQAIALKLGLKPASQIQSVQKGVDHSKSATEMDQSSPLQRRAKASAIRTGRKR